MLFECILVNLRDITKKVSLVYSEYPPLYILIVFLAKIVFIGLKGLTIKQLDKMGCIRHKTEGYNVVFLTIIQKIICEMGSVAVHKQ